MDVENEVRCVCCLCVCVCVSQFPSHMLVFMLTTIKGRFLA
jgi:hypothetical protein